ncbi:hypothetical protein [Bacillus sp. E(2018)]|uniref:hypothetical protein n=1 Tax=Bacillus sp. E(2018) TaxID=2502239 RepID=UPI0010F550F8|nr:hypothetical protein [Bacillus sp. E(2018)]
MKQALYVTCVYFIICLFLFPFLSITNWSLLTSTLLLLSFTVGYLTFKIRNWWISFPITAMLVTLYVYFINSKSSIDIPIHVPLIMGLFYLINGVTKQLRNNR